MATNETNGISLRRLKTFLTNLKNIFAEKKHSHATSDITGLDNALSNKAPKNHTHTKSQITDFPTSMPANGGNSDTVNGHTVNSDVPANAKFTDTNTWRGIQDNLTSTSTTDSLSANQGKVLKGLVDSKVTESQNVATDLNNIKSTGIHHISASTSNNPTGTHGTLFAEFNVGTPYQIWLPDNLNTAYKRNYTTSTSSWGIWTQLKFTDTNTVTNIGTTSSNCTNGNILIQGSGATTVTKSGNTVTISSTNTDTNTWRPLGTTADTACAGNDSRLSNARPASDVYSWAKASSKPSYTKSEIGLGNVNNTADAEKSVKYATSAGSASSASKTTGIVDYGSTGKTIQIGYGGDGISGDAIKYIAGYTTGNGSDVNAKIKDVSKDALKSWLGLGSLAYSSATIPTNTNQLTNGAGYITGINKTMVVNALGYTPPTTNTTYNVATQSSNGLFSASDKKKLDGITSGSNTVMKLISSTDYSKLTDAQKKNGTVYFVV